MKDFDLKAAKAADAVSYADALIEELDKKK